MNESSMMTIVVPVYNRAGVLERTLRSIERQTLRPLDVVLVDNNSTDCSRMVMEQWKMLTERPDFRITILTELTPGAAAARNRGLAVVDTPVTLFFDSDDVMAPDHCSEIAEAFAAHPEVDIVGRDVVYSGSAAVGRKGFGPTHWDNIMHGGLSTQRYAARTELFRRAGGWNPECRGWDDVELGERLLALRPIALRLKGAPTVTVLTSSDSITGEYFYPKAAVWESALDMMERTAETVVANKPGESLKVRRIVNLRRAILAGDYYREPFGRDSREGACRLFKNALTKEGDFLHRLQLRYAFYHTLLIGRGAARLLGLIKGRV